MEEHMEREDENESNKEIDNRYLPKNFNEKEKIKTRKLQLRSNFNDEI